MPFYLLHQPVIILIAYFFVLWEASIPVNFFNHFNQIVLDHAGTGRAADPAYQACAQDFGKKPRRETQATLV